MWYRRTVGRVVIFLVIAATVSGLSASQSVADNQGAPPSDQYSLSSEQIEDINRLAEQTGQSPLTLMQGARGQEEFSALLASLESTEANTLVSGIWVGGDGNPRGEIVFNYEPNSQTLSSIVNFGSAINVSYRELPSRVELESQTQRLYSGMLSMPGVKEATASPNFETGTINIEYIGSISESELSLSLQREATQQSRLTGMPILVNVEQSMSGAFGQPEYLG